MNRAYKCLLIVMTLGASAPAFADETFYGAVDIGQTRAADVCNLGGSGCTSTSAVFRVSAGYQFVSMLGAEASYAYYGKQGLGTRGGAAMGDWKASGFELAGVGAFPIVGAFSLTAKVGIAPTTFEVTGPGRSTTVTNLAWGVGARYDFNRDVGVRAQYESLGTVGDATTGKTKLTLITAGIVARF